jgi:HJR/Mrr/RecB family endonuclease
MASLAESLRTAISFPLSVPGLFLDKAMKKKNEPNTTVIFILSAVGISILLIYQLTQTLAGWLFMIGLCLLTGAAIFFKKIYPRCLKAQRLRALRIADVDNMSGAQFEHYIDELLKGQGFRTTLTPTRNDYGVDIVAELDGIKYAIQCKRYGENISRDAVSDAVAGKHYYDCSQAMVVTNRYFRKGAIELANAAQCVLIDRDVLAGWIESFQTAQSSQNSGTGWSDLQAMAATRRPGVALVIAGSSFLGFAFLLFSLSSGAKLAPQPVSKSPLASRPVKASRKRGTNEGSATSTPGPVEQEEMRRIEAGLDESQKSPEDRGR